MVKSRNPRKTTSPGAQRESSSFAKNTEDDDGNGLNLSNHFLIAMPSMPEDPVFGGSVVYLCEHNAGGALGVIINKPTDMSIDTLLERIDLTLEIAPNGVPLDGKPVMFGGPVQVERGFVLHTPVNAFSSMMTVSDDIVLTTSKDVLEAVAHGAGPARILVTLGCAGWSPGQLEQEIANNGWLTVRADPRIVFDLPIEQRFDAAMRLLGIDPMMLSGVAGHA
jgi:putative transcriptional regulator